MKRALVILALTAGVCMPAVAFAQPAPSTPSPELRSMMEKIHAEAKTAAFAALSPAHAASVTSITAKVAAGSLDPRAASQQIDDLLTADEEKNVKTAERKARENMRAAMEAAGGGMGGFGGPPPGGGMRGGPGQGDPGGPPPGMGGPGEPGMGGHGPGGHFGPSAGRYLLMVSMTPEQMRSMRPKPRGSAAP